jgi:hypothetical protein
MLFQGFIRFGSRLLGPLLEKIPVWGKGGQALELGLDLAEFELGL